MKSSRRNQNGELRFVFADLRSAASFDVDALIGMLEFLDIGHQLYRDGDTEYFLFPVQRKRAMLSVAQLIQRDGDRFVAFKCPLESANQREPFRFFASSLFRFFAFGDAAGSVFCVFVVECLRSFERNHVNAIYSNALDISTNEGHAIVLAQRDSIEIICVGAQPA